MMLRLGRCGDDRLLARPTVELMTSDPLTAEQKAGTSFCIDPREDMVTILLTQRLMTGPGDTVISDDFLTLAYQAIDD